MPKKTKSAPSNAGRSKTLNRRDDDDLGAPPFPVPALVLISRNYYVCVCIYGAVIEVRGGL